MHERNSGSVQKTRPIKRIQTMISDEECFDLLKELVNKARQRGTDSQSYQATREEIWKAINTDIGARDFFRTIFKGIGTVPREERCKVRPSPEQFKREHQQEWIGDPTTKDVCPNCDGISNSCGRCGGTGYIHVQAT